MNKVDNIMNGLNIDRISEDMFRINKYNFTRVPFVDVVTTSAPYFHFQILEPEDEEQRAQAIKYFKENEKTYISSPKVAPKNVSCTLSFHRVSTFGFED